ncbi:anti-sigma factor domain-containing protein [Novosphingobium sp. ZW T3_23]|uniref:anti-sigma factor n=1 Tax=Novosphingobium sp. ZW T3_23 TaxID=3378084 RepID=UPI003851A757
MIDTPDDHDRSVLAAELALGMLDGTERAQALRLYVSDPAFAREVDGWSTKLSPLLDTLPPALPSSRVWDAVATRVGHGPQAESLKRMRAWRAGALASGAIAVALALILTLPLVEAPERTPMAVSQLVGTDGARGLAITYDPRRGVLRAGSQALTSAGAGTDKSPELWIIPQDGVPRSLGLMVREGGEMTIDPALRPFLASDATLAITMEDPVTAPHAAPSGLPVMSGKISII